jgi:hypothetical protein
MSDGVVSGWRGRVDGGWNLEIMWSRSFWPITILVATLVIAGCGGQTTATPGGESTEAPSAESNATSAPQPSPPSSAPSVDDGCPVPDEEADDLPASYRPVGDSLEGDLRGDGRSTRAMILGDEERPLECRYFLAVGYPQDTRSHARIDATSLPYDVPSLLMAVEIDGQPGLEVVVDFGGPMHPHRTGQVFTFEGPALVATRIEPAQLDGIPPILFPLGGEFAAGVDCAAEPGTIVLTVGGLAEGGTDDSHYDVTRTFYRAQGGRFVESRRETHTIEVGTERERWPELADDPFRSCSGAK